MKTILIILISLIIPLAHSESFMDFHEYIHSIKYTLRPGESLKDVLQKQGYDLNQKDWYQITLRHNGLTEKDLVSLNSPRRIYLPPQRSYQEYLGAQRLTAEKMSCQPISKKFLLDTFGTDSKAYREYFEVITSRKVQVKKGQRIEPLIENDQFSYGTISRGVRLMKEANGLEGNVIQKDGYVYLPFCVPENELPVTALPEVKREEKPKAVVRTKKPVQRQKPLKKERPLWNFYAGLIYGSVDIDRGSNKLSTDFFKVSGLASRLLNDKFTLSGTVSLTKFFNVSHSEASETQSPSSLYPEFGIDLVRNYSRWNLGVGYDMLNYFVASDLPTKVKIDPIRVHRISVKPSFVLTEHWRLTGGAGFLKSFSDEEVSGYDISAGIVRSFGKSNRFFISGNVFRNEMDTAESSENDVSTGWSLSFFMRI